MTTSSPYFSISKRSYKVTAIQSIKRLSTRNRKRPLKIEYETDRAVEEPKLDKKDSKESVIDINDLEKTNTNKTTKGKAVKSKVAVKQDTSWKPKNWEIILSNIKEMRKDKTAVVDSKGCERTADAWEKPEVIRYQTLVSLMLSSQTRDQVTFAAMEKLKTHGLTIPKIIKTSEDKVGELIRPVSFWKRKAQFIKQASQICHDKFKDDIPNTIDGLISLPGVGPKMAYICLNAAWGEVAGIGVDTHVHRIANRLNWLKKPSNTPEKTRAALEAWLPRSEWKDINILLVGFGQQTCLPVGPKCSTCLNKDICPAATAKSKGDNF